MSKQTDTQIVTQTVTQTAEQEAEKKADAQWISQHPVVAEILNEMEQDAIENAVNANTKDDETRRSAMNKVRAIRELRQQINQIAENKMPQTTKKDVA